MNRNRYLAQAAVIAAMYVLLTYLSFLPGLSGGAVQIRFSEALCILPVFTSAAVPGLFVGCLISNLLTGCAVWDIVFGSLATLVGALGSYAVRRTRYPLLAASLPPILSNVAVVPLILTYVYGASEAYPFLLATVGAGEILSCGVLGIAIGKALYPYRDRLFHR